MPPAVEIRSCRRYFLPGMVVIAPLGALAGGLPWQPLFNGNDLTGWAVPQPNPYWTAGQGVLVGENNAAQAGSMLYTQASWQDFLFETDVKWSGEIDSGIMLRRPELQLQLGISRSLQRDMTCSFYTGSYPASGQAQGVAGLWRSGDWNTIRLQASGSLFIVWLNGTLVTEYSNNGYAQSGPIGLQIHPGVAMRVEFRNLRVIAGAVADADEDGLPDAWERSQWATLRHTCSGDFDSDGIANRMEFALGLDPRVPALGGLPRLEPESIGGQTYPALTVTRNPSAVAVVFRVEVSDDLIAWRAGPADCIALEDTPARLRVRDAIPMSASTGRFLRLAIDPP